MGAGSGTPPLCPVDPALFKSLLRNLPAAVARLATRGSPGAGPVIGSGQDPSHGRSAVGPAKERLARAWLEHQGLVHLDHNVRCRRGEVDLVMRDGDTLVFVEVRFRRSESFGGAAASVDRRKQVRIAAAAAHYLQRHPTRLPCRFDVLAIGADDQMHWIRHAFDQT
ncbi:MAG: YraN family protein [Chromatiaceae bacterium]|nr:MAG: YraN family protein [Chromatiaceae bacterium]